MKRGKPLNRDDHPRYKGIVRDHVRKVRFHVLERPVEHGIFFQSPAWEGRPGIDEQVVPLRGFLRVLCGRFLPGGVLGPLSVPGLSCAALCGLLAVCGGFLRAGVQFRPVGRAAVCAVQRGKNRRFCHTVIGLHAVCGGDVQQFRFRHAGFIVHCHTF